MRKQGRAQDLGVPDQTPLSVPVGPSSVPVGPMPTRMLLLPRAPGGCQTEEAAAGNAWPRRGVGSAGGPSFLCAVGK